MKKYAIAFLLLLIFAPSAFAVNTLVVYQGQELAPYSKSATSVPPPTTTVGTNLTTGSLSYDAAVLECRSMDLKVPADITSGNVTFYWDWWSTGVTSGNVVWDIRHSGGQAEGASWDTAPTTVAATADAVQGTVKQETFTTVTETVANLGWAALDDVTIEVCRNGASGSDTMAGDAELKQFAISIPVA